MKLTKSLLLTLMVSVLWALPAQARWTVAGIKAKFRHEPTLRQLQGAALKFFRVSPSRVNSLRRAASWKAVLPVITGGFTGKFMKFDRNLQVAQYRLSYPQWPWEVENQVDTHYQVGVSATWNLPLLIFNPEELDVTSLVGIQDGVLKEVTRLYFIRRRLQISLLTKPPKDAMTLLMLELRLQEISGLMDAMTNGYLSRELSRAKKNRLSRSALSRKGLVVPAAFKVVSIPGGVKRKFKTAARKPKRRLSGRLKTGKPPAVKPKPVKPMKLARSPE